MDHTFKLPPRLAAIAALVPDGARLADVGTDHALLPIRLLLDGKIQSAVATDIRPGPLSRAKENAYAAGVQDLSCVLCDGLTGISPDSVDTVVIAGMGGENIAAILAAAPWTADGCHTLLLQPQSRAESLRQFLSENGYRIAREELVLDRGTLYPAMEVTAGCQTLTTGQLWGGACLTRDPLGDRYLIEKILRLQGAVAGLAHSSRPEDRGKADGLRDVLTALLSMREEWRHANGTGN